MSKIERIIITVLTTAALAGIAFSFYAKSLKNNTAPLQARDADEAEKARCLIERNIVIDINTADKETLTKIPGIGPSIAQDIIDYRRENGGFMTRDEIMNVKGIGPKKYDSIKEYIRVDE